MKKFRLSIALVLLALVLTIVPAAFAQDTTLGASQSDYDLWSAANAATAAASTVSFSFKATFGVTGMQDATQNSSGTLTGTGVIDNTDKANPAFQLDITGTNSQSGKDTPISFNLRRVGGNIYYNTGTGWTGGTPAQVMTNISNSIMQGMLGGSGLPAATPQAAAPDTQNAMMTQAMAFLSQLKPSDFLTLSRTDANGLAQFTLNVNMQKLLAEPALTAMASATPEVSAGATSAFSMTSSMLPMIMSIFSGATVTVNEYVDPSSKIVQRAVLDFGLPLGADDSGNPTGVKLNLDVTLSNYNQPVTVEVPANAQMLGASSGG